MSTTYEDHCASLGLVYPPEKRGEKGGSTDMGDVSYVLPSIQPKFAIPTDFSTHNIGFMKSAGENADPRVFHFSLFRMCTPPPRQLHPDIF